MIVYEGKQLSVFALVLGGGSGRRMTGTEMPKQYLMLGERPVILHSVQRFLDNAQVDRVIMVCPADHLEYTESLAAKYLTDTSHVSFTAGGADRNASLMKGMLAAKAFMPAGGDAVVLTHDAARPFLTDRIIAENIASAAAYGACTTAVPAVDTIMRSEDGQVISEIPKRSLMYQVQTPQSFRFSVLFQTMNSLKQEELGVLTDTCGILQARGVPVRLVMGENYNIKLTYPQDMITAEGILKSFF